MGKLWKVKTARIKGENLVIVAEKEVPLSKILDNEVLESEPDETEEAPEEEDEEEEAPGAEPEEEEEVSDEDARQRLGIEKEDKGEKVLERAEKLQDKIEKVEMETGSHVSNLKGQKGRILASIEAGNESLPEISNDTKIGVPSVSGQLNWLTKNGFAKRVDRGQYKITAKGKNYLKKLEAA